MSTHVLHIDSSIFGDAGVSNQLGSRFVKALVEALPGTTITHRDLAAAPLPHFSTETIAAIGEGKAELADTLIAELQAADILVIGAPMYNFTIPSGLKAWFDHIARAGTTFKYTENGAVGLLQNKRVVVFTSRGGVHRDGPTDHLTPYLKTLLGFLGLHDVKFVYAEGLNLSGGREPGIAAAQADSDAHLRELTQVEEAI